MKSTRVLKGLYLAAACILSEAPEKRLRRERIQDSQDNKTLPVLNSLRSGKFHGEPDFRWAERKGLIRTAAGFYFDIKGLPFGRIRSVNKWLDPERPLE